VELAMKIEEPKGTSERFLVDIARWLTSPWGEESGQNEENIH